MVKRLDVLVIGGGPAGAMAAITAAQNGATVQLWEKNSRLGRKLAITGKGRCNITNAGEIKEIIANLTGNGPFLYSAITRFDNQQVMDFFRAAGVPVKVERGRRVFPESDSAQQVVDALERELQRAGVVIVYNCAATELLPTAEGDWQVSAHGRQILAQAVIVATGGVTYQATGSTGDGYRFAEAVGHTVITPKPSLVPLVASDKWVSEAAGLALKNASVTISCAGRVLDSAFGEMLFTHFGVSGPVILSLSRGVCAYWQKHGKVPLQLTVDLKPALTPEQLDIRLLRDFEKFTRKQFGNSLAELLPKSLIPIMIELAGIPAEMPVNQITKEQRLRFRDLLKALPLSIVDTRPINEAIVTAGGICVKEVDPKTMESKIAPGLYFAGEVLDVDGYTGGYNLQAAFSTGAAAGNAQGCRG